MPKPKPANCSECKWYIEDPENPAEGVCSVSPAAIYVADTPRFTNQAEFWKQPKHKATHAPCQFAKA